MFSSDFGLSHYLDDRVRKASDPSLQIRRYAAPEVASSKNRGSAADIFLLGCVFLEMMSVVCGDRIEDLLTYISDANEEINYYSHLARICSWTEEKLEGDLCYTGSSFLRIIVTMLDYNP